MALPIGPVSQECSPKPGWLCNSIHKIQLGHRVATQASEGTFWKEGNEEQEEDTQVGGMACFRRTADSDVWLIELDFSFVSSLKTGLLPMILE